MVFNGKMSKNSELHETVCRKKLQKLSAKNAPIKIWGTDQFDLFSTSIHRLYFDLNLT